MPRRSAMPASVASAPLPLRFEPSNRTCGFIVRTCIAASSFRSPLLGGVSRPPRRRNLLSRFNANWGGGGGAAIRGSAASRFRSASMPRCIQPSRRSRVFLARGIHAAGSQCGSQCRWCHPWPGLAASMRRCAPLTRRTKALHTETHDLRPRTLTCTPPRIIHPHATPASALYERRGVAAGTSHRKPTGLRRRRGADHASNRPEEPHDASQGLAHANYNTDATEAPPRDTTGKPSQTTNQCTPAPSRQPISKKRS